MSSASTVLSPHDRKLTRQGHPWIRTGCNESAFVLITGCQRRIPSEIDIYFSINKISGFFRRRKPLDKSNLSKNPVNLSNFIVFFRNSLGPNEPIRSAAIPKSPVCARTSNAGKYTFVLMGWSQKIAPAGGRFGCLWRRFKEGRAPMRSEPLWLKLARRIPPPPVCCRPVRRARRRRRRPADPWRRPWCRPAQRPPGRRRSARRGSRFPSSSPRSPPTRRLPRPPRLRRRTL